jgi:hypothetical protein
VTAYYSKISASAHVETRILAGLLRKKQQLSGGGLEGGPHNLKILPPILKIQIRVVACFSRFGIRIVGHSELLLVSQDSRACASESN